KDGQTAAAGDGIVVSPWAKPFRIARAAPTMEVLPMKRRTFLRSAFAIGALGSTPLAGLEPVFAAPAPAAPMGPLLTKWGGPYGGIPPFGVVKATDIKPGLLRGMDLLRAEIRQIAGDKAAPTFENTLVRFEDSGRPLGQAATFFDIYTGTMNDK